MKVEEQVAVVWVRRSSCESVTEMEELVGRFSFASRFPQYLLVREYISWVSWRGQCKKYNGRGRGSFTYLTTAILTGAVVLA